MKIWIRLVVAFSVVLVLTFAVWAFFFDEKDEVVVYNDMTQMIEFKESLGIEDRLDDLSNYNYIGKDKSKVITKDNYPELFKVRTMLFSEDVINEYDDKDNIVATYDSYLTYDKLSNEIFKDVLPYLNGKNTHRKTQKAFTAAVKNYINQLKILNADIDLIVKSQDVTTNENSSISQLVAKYNSLRSKYRKLMGYAGEVISYSIGYLNAAVYGGDFKADTDFALYDCYGRTLKAFASVHINQEIVYSNTIHYAVDKIEKSNSNTNIFSVEYTELEFLQAKIIIFT